jgi:hypothetical protein
MEMKTVKTKATPTVRQRILFSRTNLRENYQQQKPAKIAKELDYKESTLVPKQTIAKRGDSYQLLSPALRARARDKELGELSQ